MSNNKPMEYRLLGRSGLRVSALALGGMTFGTATPFGVDEAASTRLLDTFLDRGGNFLDTANFYSMGQSEEIIGRYFKEKRNNIVIATKYSMMERQGDPNSGGNHRKSMMNTVENSLRRMNTDYIDLLYLHTWDFTTRVDEIMRGLDDLVRQGKVMYIAMSNVPAWQIARMQTIADLRGWAPLVALQIEYNLTQRESERELIPMARELELGIISWSPLAGGILSGKYTRENTRADSTQVLDERRKSTLDVLGMFNEKKMMIADVVRDVAAELGKTPAQIAIAWVLTNPAVTAPLVGASSSKQLEDNFGALDVEFDPSHLQRLDEVSAINRGYPHEMLDEVWVRQFITGDLVKRRG